MGEQSELVGALSSVNQGDRERDRHRVTRGEKVRLVEETQEGWGGDER